MPNNMTKEWRFRREGDLDQGVIASVEIGLKWLEDGIISAEDQVSEVNPIEWSVLGNHPYWSQMAPDSANDRKVDEDEVDPDMTSMIDVVFQLIIFFMVAASLTVQKTLDSPHQKTEEQGAVATESELQDEHVFVVLAADGTVNVNDEIVSADSYDTLLDVLKNAISAMDNSEMVLDAPDNVKHEHVVAILDAAAGAEVDKVLFIARPSQSMAEDNAN